MHNPATPTTFAEWDAAGQRFVANGSLDEAARCFQHAIELEPTIPLTWVRLAKVQLATLQHDLAEAALLRACTLEPNNPAWQVLHAYVLREQNKTDAALDACDRALRINPANLHAAVARAMMAPAIYANSHDVRSWRERIDRGLEALTAQLPGWLHCPNDILTLEWQNFLLAYQGEDDIELQSRYSDFVARLIGAAKPGLQLPLHRVSTPRERIRIGFVSSEFRNCTIGDYFYHWVTDLPRHRFHITTIHTGHVEDARTREYAHGSDAFVHVTGEVERIALAVRDRELDVVIFPEVGSSARSTLLANLRLAPLQCAAWGHPTTTGSRFVEYYISCAEMEPKGAERHYRESLLLLPGIGVRYRAPLSAQVDSRSKFGLSADSNVYLCPQSLYKIHPDTDRLLLDILERDENAVIVFFVARAQGQTRAFAERLGRGLSHRGIAPRKQVKFFPRMSHGDFLAVMRMADVMIDAVHWSGGNTTLDALASALPVVTLEGRHMRGRQTAAMLRIVRLDELIARDVNHYVELATRVATDKALRTRLSDRIRDGLPRLFDRSEPIVALGEAIEQVCTTMAR